MEDWSELIRAYGEDESSESYTWEKGTFVVQEKANGIWFITKVEKTDG